MSRHYKRKDNFPPILGHIINIDNFLFEIDEILFFVMLPINRWMILKTLLAYIKKYLPNICYEIVFMIKILEGILF